MIVCMCHYVIEDYIIYIYANQSVGQIIARQDDLIEKNKETLF